MQSSGSHRLTVRQGPVPGKILELVKESITIGRDVNNDLVINDAEVSRNHTRVTSQAGGYLIEDLASTNGTFVNGQRLISPKLLNAGDVIGLGETIVLEFGFVADAGATVVASAPPPPMRPADEPPTAPPFMPPPEPEPMPEPMAPATMAEPLYTGATTGGMAAPEPEPSYMPPPAPPPPAPAPKKSNTPLIVGGVCGCLTLLCICLVAVYFAYPAIMTAVGGQ